MFLGSHQHTIDSKSRLILPSSFRSRLADGAVVTPLDSCLGVLPASEFERLAQKLEAEVSEAACISTRCAVWPARRIKSRPMPRGGCAFCLVCGKMAGLGRSVIVTGAFARVEVWAIDRWEEVNAAGTEALSKP